MAGPDHAREWGLARSLRLFRSFRQEQAEPEAFYAVMARDAADQLARYLDLAGQTVVDVGGGPGHFTAEFRARGAASYVFEPDRAEMFSRGRVPAGAVLANGFWLPVADGASAVCFSSNVIEHVVHPPGRPFRRPPIDPVPWPAAKARYWPEPLPAAHRDDSQIQPVPAGRAASRG